MLSKEVRNELKRLRLDFEFQASRYHDLTLSTYFVTDAPVQKVTTFNHPNHLIVLWQYIGNLSANDIDQEFLEDLQNNEIGVASAEVTAVGVIEGVETKLFTQMAIRAGSLIEEEANHTLVSMITRKFIEPNRSGKPTLVVNRNPLALWLNLTLVCVATHQPKRFTNHTLAVDPFAASLAVFDYFFDRFEDHTMVDNPMNSIPFLDRKFKIALTFPGEKREFVGEVAKGLNQRLGAIFYDEDFTAELARPNLDVILQKIYHDNSELVIVFLCSEYAEKEWCGIEFRAVRDLIKQRTDNVMLMRFDNADIDGIFSIDGYVDLERFSPDDAIDLIIERYLGLKAASGPEDEARFFATEDGPVFERPQYKSAPNIRYMAESLFPQFVELDVNVFNRAAGKAEGYMPIIVGFENTNDPSKKVRELKNVRAQISYRERGFLDHEMIRVGNGCWVDHHLPDVDFPIATPRHLFLGGLRLSPANPQRTS